MVEEWMAFDEERPTHVPHCVYDGEAINELSECDLCEICGQDIVDGTDQRMVVIQVDPV
jgi:hypothetical protein